MRKLQRRDKALPGQQLHSWHSIAAYPAAIARARHKTMLREGLVKHHSNFSFMCISLIFRTKQNET